VALGVEDWAGKAKVHVVVWYPGPFGARACGKKVGQLLSGFPFALATASAGRQALVGPWAGGAADRRTRFRQVRVAEWALLLAEMAAVIAFGVLGLHFAGETDEVMWPWVATITGALVVVMAAAVLAIPEMLRRRALGIGTREGMTGLLALMTAHASVAVSLVLVDVWVFFARG
jgi:hypothetical protein